MLAWRPSPTLVTFGVSSAAAVTMLAMWHRAYSSLATKSSQHRQASSIGKLPKATSGNAGKKTEKKVAFVRPKQRLIHRPLRGNQIVLFFFFYY
jgi:hypothetical protein